MKTINKYCKPLVLLVIITACDGSIEDQSESAPVEERIQTHVRLEPNQVEKANIKLGTPQKRSMAEKTHVNGYLDVPPGNKASVASLVDAYVKRTSLLIGDKVVKGQMLAVLEHPDIISLQNEFIEKNQHLTYLRSEYERQKSLDADKINAKKILIKSETDFKGMEASVNGVKARLIMMGMSPDEVLKGNIYSSIQLRSPLNGFITEVHAVLGKLVKSGEPLFEIIDPDHLHVELKVFEKDIHKVKIGEPFNFSLGGSDEVYTGKIHLIGKQLDEERAIDVHGHIDIENDLFIPGMYVEAEIYGRRDTVMVVPEDAIVKRENKSYVFRQTGENIYEVVEIIPGRQSDGWFEIKNGALELSDAIVVEGSYVLSSMAQ